MTRLNEDGTLMTEEQKEAEAKEPDAEPDSDEQNRSG